MVFRVYYETAQRTKLVALDLATKQWYQSPPLPWASHREQLKAFGISEFSLRLTDSVLSTGTRDTQFAAVAVPLQDLERIGFAPLVW